VVYELLPWQERLRRFVAASDSLPEPVCDWYEARPPSKEPWPDGLPKTPALQAFYTLCDGGRFLFYDIRPLDEIEAETDSLREWAGGGDGGEEAPTEGRWFVVGHHNEAGSHAVVWDEARDRVGLYSGDDGYGWLFGADGGYDFIGGTLAAFWEELFTPPRKPRDDEVDRAWVEILNQGEAED
jgi:hypothetical protein